MKNSKPGNNQGQSLSPILALVLLATATAASGQTFVPLRVTASQTNAVLDVGTNILARFQGYVGSGSARTYVCYDGFDATGKKVFLGQTTYVEKEPSPALGPCNIVMEAIPNDAGNIAPGFMGQMLIELVPVNAATGPGAVFTLETSTNLTTWQVMTNAVFPSGEPARFFRSSIRFP